MSCKISITVLTAFVFVAAFAQATKNLGTVGETYPVVEPDVVAELQQEAAKQDKAGNTPLFSQQIKMYQPANLHTLPRAAENRTFLVDMSYTLDRDLIDSEGRVLYPKGYTFNPLDYISFPGGLLVIDGADPSQVTWFEKTPYADNHQARLLLSNGYAFELTRQLKRPVFYLTSDIAERLQLTAVPSIIIQKDDKLLIREVLIPRDKQGELDDKK